MELCLLIIVKFAVLVILFPDLNVISLGKPPLAFRKTGPLFPGLVTFLLAVSRTASLNGVIFEIGQQIIEESTIDVDAIIGIFLKPFDEFCFPVANFNWFTIDILEPKISEQVFVLEKPIKLLVIFGFKLRFPFEDSMMRMPTALEHLLKFLLKLWKFEENIFIGHLNEIVFDFTNINCTLVGFDKPEILDF